jgi:hypothetical protein
LSNGLTHYAIILVANKNDNITDEGNEGCKEAKHTEFLMLMIFKGVLA